MPQNWDSPTNNKPGLIPVLEGLSVWSSEFKLLRNIIQQKVIKFTPTTKVDSQNIHLRSL